MSKGVKEGKVYKETVGFLIWRLCYRQTSPNGPS